MPTPPADLDRCTYITRAYNDWSAIFLYTPGDNIRVYAVQRYNPHERSETITPYDDIAGELLTITHTGIEFNPQACTHFLSAMIQPQPLEDDANA